MIQEIAHITLVVDDYDEAINFYTKGLNFELIEDTQISETKRWVLVAPKGSKGCSLLLAKATTEEQKSRIGNQTGGRVFIFLYTNDLKEDYEKLLKLKIRIIRPPKEEPYGTVLVFSDHYGNLFDLIQPKK